MILVYCELAGATISRVKSEFLMSELKMVAFMCSMNGRRPDPVKVDKVVKWGPCTDLTNARAFIGLCVYYRIWIRNFTIIAEPIYALSKKGTEFIWGERQQEAMDTLKNAFINTPVLRPIDYQAKGRIILSVDSSLIGWGAILQQEDEDSVGKARRKRKIHPARYEGGI